MGHTPTPYIAHGDMHHWGHAHSHARWVVRPAHPSGGHSLPTVKAKGMCIGMSQNECRSVHAPHARRHRRRRRCARIPGRARGVCAGAACRPSRSPSPAPRPSKSRHASAVGARFFRKASSGRAHGEHTRGGGGAIVEVATPIERVPQPLGIRRRSGPRGKKRARSEGRVTKKLILQPM